MIAENTKGKNLKKEKLKKDKIFIQHIREAAVLISSALILAYIFKSFLFQPYKVEMNSMSPTIYPSERIIVNKISYRFNKPKKSDIITLYSPDPPVITNIFGSIPYQYRKVYVKRVVATQGDKINAKEGILYVNGKKIPEAYLKEKGEVSDFTDIIIPRDEVYVLGDNRDNSRDSRNFGPIDNSDVIGKVIFIYWPLSQFRAVV